MTTFNAGQVLTAAELNSAFGAKVDADAAAITGGYAEGLDHVYVTGTTNATSTGTGAVVVAGGVGIAMDVYVGGNTTLSGALGVGSTAPSSSPTTGALVVAGGVGVGTNLNVGGSVSVMGSTASAGQLQANSSTDATNTATGALVVAGGVGVAKSLYVGGGANVGGNLVVAGNATITGQLSTSELIVLSGGSGIQFSDGTQQTTAGEVAGELTTNTTGGTVNITTAQAAVNTIFNFTGALTSNLTVVFPAKAKVCTIANNTTGSFTLTVQVAGQAPSVVVGQGVATQTYTDASGAYQITAASIALPLAVNQGGTGATTPAAAAVNLNVAALTGAAFTGAVTVATSIGVTDATNGAGQISVTSTGPNGANIQLNGNGSTTPNKTIRANGGNLQVVNSAYSTVVLTLTDAGALTVNSSITATGGLLDNGSDAGGLGLRLITGNYGAGIRNDGTVVYFLSTASGSPSGSFNSLRPFSWNLSSGSVGIDGTGAGTTFGGGILVNGVSSFSGGISAGNFSYRPTFNGAVPWDNNNLPWPVTSNGSGGSVQFNWDPIGGVPSMDVVVGGTVVGHAAIGYPNHVAFNWSGSSLGVYVDASYQGYMWTSGNFNPANYAPVSGSHNYVTTDGAHLYEMWWGVNGSGTNVLHFDVDGGEQATLIGVAVSDRNVKEDIHPVIRDSVGLIESLDFVSFKYIDSVSSGQRRPIGVIAQDAQKSYQDSVFEIDGKMYMDERTMLYDALHAVKQLSAEVKRLKAKLH